jgi:hypothetical protein
LFYFFYLCCFPIPLVIVVPTTHHHHHQPINFLTAGAHESWSSYKKTAHNPPRGPSADKCVLTTTNAAGINGLTCLPKLFRARDNKFLVTHPVIDQSCLTFTIAHRAHWPRGHRAIAIFWILVIDKADIGNQS